MTDAASAQLNQIAGDYWDAPLAHNATNTAYLGHGVVSLQTLGAIIEERI